MSADETKWKKKVKVNNNIPHVPAGRKKNDTTRNDSMSALNELKNKIESIKNKRNGFTRLPNLEDIHTKQLDDLITPEGEDDDVNIEEKPNIEEGFNVKSFLSNKQLVRYLSIILAYIFAIISYLHIIFKNYKDEIVGKVVDEGIDASAEETLNSSETSFDKLVGQITVLLTSVPGSDEYVKHYDGNKMLKCMGFLCQFPLMKYILLPAQAFIILFDFLIESSGKNFEKGTFEVGSLFVILSCVYVFSGLVLSGKMDGLIGSMGKGAMGKQFGSIKIDPMKWFKALYKALPLSYFIIMGIIIVILFAIDGVNELRSNVAGFGLVGLIVYVFSNIFMLSMSIVLSGFSALLIIPYAIYSLLKPPEGLSRYGAAYILILLGSIGTLIYGAVKDDKTTLVTAFSLTMALMSMFHVVFLEGNIYKSILDSHYKRPEFDSCDEKMLTKIKMLIKRFWNNKFMFGFIMIFSYIAFDMSNIFDSGRIEKLNAIFPATIALFILIFWGRYMYKGMPETTFIIDATQLLNNLRKKFTDSSIDTSHNVIEDKQETNGAIDEPLLGSVANTDNQ
jgi:hypothetical protein